MSGIPQELVQRLAQELLRQVRLEAALDHLPAITLATEEAAAARVEAGLAAPATAEQAKPEEMPRPIHPFLQRLAQPTPLMMRLAPLPALPSCHQRRTRQSSQPGRITSHYHRRAAHVSRRVYPRIQPASEP